ncbi:MFS transporter [Arthrobacter crystallopoietes]|uniref:MFS transporter n=1 Tax=Crystallibacter crystallopoietes TaxID=37928 RepID=UPI001ABE27BA|nr:MFS transporter [Arthrobacter crystallopoietes]QTG80540.1 MFS transporter [Arthrobacter crystallopoietes]
MTEPPAAAEGALSVAYRSLTIGLLAIITLTAFEAMAVATAMPVVAQELHGQSSYGLAFSMFLTASLLATVVAGIWCDVRGPTPSLGLGLALMVVGLVLSGVADSFWLFTAGRAIAGLGGGFLIVAVYVIIGQAYPQQVQPVVFGWLAAAWVVPSLIGPYVAGLLAQYLSWRLVFYGVAPIVLLAVLVIWPSVRHLGAPEEPTMDRRLGKQQVVRGLVLAGGVFLAQWAVYQAVQMPEAGTAAALYAVAGVGAVLGLLALPGLMPAGTLRLKRGLPSVVATRGCINLAFFGAEAFIPLMLVASHGISPATAGLALTSGAVGWSIGSFVQARVRTDRHWLLVIGSGVLAAAMGLMSLLTNPAAPFWLLILVWGIAGFSMGMALSTTSVMILKMSAPAERGRNSASLQLADQLGGVVGTAGAGSLFALLRNPDNPADTGVYVVIWLALAVFAAASMYTGWRSAEQDPLAANRKEFRKV